jgi:peptidoglycan/xylan/chitin deacetylase (PgdA/CDA1 family)
VHRDALLIFNWHQVSPTFNPFSQHEYTWTSFDAFETSVDYLSRNYRIVPLHGALNQLKSGTLRGRCVALTFDDGDISMADYVMPFLKRRGLSATFFINTAYLDGRRAYWFPILSYLTAGGVRHPALSAALHQQALQLRQTNDCCFYQRVREGIERLAPVLAEVKPRLVSPDWLAALDGEQFAIGAHGHEHERYAMMSVEWQRENLVENIRVLRRFRAYRPIFAVPFGRPWDWTAQSISIVRNLGLEVLLADGGVNLSAGDVYNRQPADAHVGRELVVQALRPVRPIA